MSNIKLSGHTWDTSGIYDANEGKTQAEVNNELKTAVNVVYVHPVAPRVVTHDEITDFAGSHYFNFDFPIPTGSQIEVTNLAQSGSYTFNLVNSSGTEQQLGSISAGQTIKSVTTLDVVRVRSYVASGINWKFSVTFGNETQDQINNNTTKAINNASGIVNAEMDIDSQSVWRNGGWDGSTGAYQPANNFRVCNTDPIKTSKPLFLKIKSGFRFGYMYLNENKEPVIGTDSGWKTGNIIIQNTYPYINCTISKVTENRDVPANIPEFTSAITVDIDGKYSEYITSYSYNGEAFDITDNKIALELYMTVNNDLSGESVQGSAVYNGVLFTAWNTMAKISVTDLATKSSLGVITLEGSSSYHCNNLNFGTEKYDADDDFPLLYVSMESTGTLLALRITKSGTTYNASVVQTITYPSGFVYYPNGIVDTENGRLYISGYTENTYIASDTNKIKCAYWELPKLSDGDTTLLLADKNSEFTIDSYTAQQGEIFINSKIISVVGSSYQSDPSMYLLAIDPYKGAVVSSFKLNNSNLINEPESVFVWNGNLYILAASRNIIKAYL